MRSAALVLAVAAFAACFDIGSARKYAVSLAGEDFEDLVGDGPALLFFGAPWCGHCKNFAPHYEKAAKALASEVMLFKIDATQERGLASRFNVRGYPSVFHISDGQVREYRGERSKSAVVNFAREGWRKVPAQTDVLSPMGPVQKARGFVMRHVGRFANLHIVIARWTGMPDLVAGFVLLLFTIMAVCSGLILVAVWMGDDRRPPPRNANPRDIRGTIKSVIAEADGAAQAAPMASAAKGGKKEGLRARK